MYLAIQREVIVYAKVSFRLTNGNQPLILVPTLVNGQGPFDFILDTGAGACFLSPELAQKLDVRATETKEAAGAGGKVRIDLGNVQSMSVGRVTVENIKVGITPELARISACCGTKIDGGLGHNFFQDFRLKLDYRNRLLTLHGGQIYPDTQDVGKAAPVGFRLAHPSKPLAVLPVLVNGSGPHPFILDTGASTTMLSTHLAKNLDVSQSGSPALTGAGGMASASLGTLRTLTIGSTELENIQVVISDFLDNLSRLIETEVKGIIGYNALSQFSVTIDYPQATLSLSP
jgi:predicted aspartyl protease